MQVYSPPNTQFGSILLLILSLSTLTSNFTLGNGHYENTRSNFYQKEVTPEEIEILYQGLLEHSDKFGNGSDFIEFPSFLNDIHLSRRERNLVSELVENLQIYWKYKDPSLYKNCAEYLDILDDFSYNSPEIPETRDQDICQWKQDCFNKVKKLLLKQAKGYLKKKILKCESVERRIWKARCQFRDW